MPDSKAEWVARVLGYDPRTKPGEAGGGEPAGLAAWQAARAAALASIDALAAAFADFPHPEAPAAIILLRSIRANLTESPTTPAQIEELETYLKTDDIIGEAEEENGFGIKVELRAPLLAALARLRAAPA